MNTDPADVAAPRERPSLAELSPVVTAALAQYGIPSGARFENLRYYNNATFRVSAEGRGPEVLRVTSNYYSQLELESEMKWLQATQAIAGVRVPSPVAALDGRLVVSAAAPGLGAARWCTLFRWLEGVHRQEEHINGSDLAEIGAAVARLHEQNARFAVPAGFARPYWDGRRWDALGVGDTNRRIVAHLERYFASTAVHRFTELVRGCRAWMLELGAVASEYGLVHGDFHTGNCLFGTAGVAFIDFEDLGWGYYLYDVATALFGMLDRPDYADLVRDFARGYAGVRPLPQPFAERLAQFQALRCVFLTSLVVTRGDLGESAWWEGYVVRKLQRLTSGVP
jgi:Ser/Thr protein kinase RdoA (MazF antagonist)